MRQICRIVGSTYEPGNCLKMMLPCGRAVSSTLVGLGAKTGRGLFVGTTVCKNPGSMDLTIASLAGKLYVSIVNAMMSRVGDPSSSLKAFSVARVDYG
jgi:hypothetical protein